MCDVSDREGTAEQGGHCPQDDWIGRRRQRETHCVFFFFACFVYLSTTFVLERREKLSTCSPHSTTPYEDDDYLLAPRARRGALKYLSTFLVHLEGEASIGKTHGRRTALHQQHAPFCTFLVVTSIEGFLSLYILRTIERFLYFESMFESARAPGAGVFCGVVQCPISSVS